MFFEDNDELVEVRRAFAKACVDLGIGPDQSDRERREQLEQAIVSLINAGESDPEVIRAKVVHQLKPPAAGLFHQTA